MPVTGGELITGVLQKHAIGTVFAIAGASHTHLLNPLDTAGLTIISNRHEAGAVGSADGYARVTQKPGMALIVADQGLPNAIGALAVAWHALSPVVLLIATPPRTFVEADTAIDQDKLALLTPVTKWARTVPAVSRLCDYLQTAIKQATTGRPGPVALLIPENILQESVEQDIRPLATTARLPPDPVSIELACDLLDQAERPIVIAGGGAAWSRAGSVLQDLNADFGLPVLGNSMGRGQVAEDNRTSFSWPYAQIAAAQADLVLVVGARLNQRLGLGLPPRFSADAHFIQIDIEPSAFNRNRPTDIALQADAKLALKAIAEGLNKRRPDRKFDSEWLRQALAPRAGRIAELKSSDGNKTHPLQLGEAIARRLPADAIYVADGADIATWMYGAICIKQPLGFLDHYPMGAMGSGTALAVGAAAALKEQNSAAPVVLVTGDGAIGFHPAELHAATLADLHLIAIVGNDGAWGTELHGQQQAIGRPINTQLGYLPYEKLGEAFGFIGLCSRAPDELEEVLDRAFSTDRPVLVNVELDQEAGRELKTNPVVKMIMFSDILSGQASLETFGTKN